jgi:FkbM family methyltransferase
MDRGFLYRRLGRLFPVCFSNVACGGISLPNKHHVASLAEVFLQPHYWRLFDLLTTPPRTVVDLGGNCGHFPVLCEMAARWKFGACNARYYVFEAVRAMVRNVKFTVTGAQIAERTTILHGAVGKKAGVAILTGNRKSMLTSSAVFTMGRVQERVRYIDLEAYFAAQKIEQVDVLKVDIEGSEYDMIETFPALFRMSQIVLMELHNLDARMAKARAVLADCGLHLVKPVLHNGADELLALRRRDSLSRPVNSSVISAT